MKLSRILMVGLLVAMAVTAWPLARERRVDGRSVHYYTDLEIEQLDDVEGHVIGRYETNGVGFQDEGEISTFYGKGTFDHVNDVGTQEGMVYRTFEDGSTIVTRFEGRSKRTKKGRVGEGAYTCVEGTGRFEGIRCDGTYSSIYLDNDMTVTDWKGKVVLERK